jgi:hypothetical protein
MLGGLPDGHRELLTEGAYGAFEQTVERLFGDRLRASLEDAQEFWGALANVDWLGPDGATVGYSFRAGGDLIAAIRRDEGEMTYMNYYCAAPYATVPDWVEEALVWAGWWPDTGDLGDPDAL